MCPRFIASAAEMMRTLSRAFFQRGVEGGRAYAVGTAHVSHGRVSVSEVVARLSPRHAWLS